MKRTETVKWVVLVLILSVACPGNGQYSPADPYLGMWALTLDYESSNAGWLEVRQEEGYLDAELLWRWGSVYPVDFTFVKNDKLMLNHGSDVIKESDEEGNTSRTIRPVIWFEISKAGKDRIEGMYYRPSESGTTVETVSFTGERIPPYKDPPDLQKARYGKPVELFNGRDLKGWTLLHPNARSAWKVVDGVLVNDPVQPENGPHIHYGNLRTKETFEDFKLTLEVNVPEGSNSGVYLRGIYEVQVMDTYGKELDAHHMGALYSRIAPSESAEKPAGAWQKMEMMLYKRHLTVILNGTKIIDNRPVKGVTGGAMTSDEFSPGPIYLQGDHGKVMYRNMELTPIRR